MWKKYFDIDLLTLQIRETKALIWPSEQNCHMWWDKKKSDDEQTCVVKDVARHQALFQRTHVSLRAKCSSAAKYELRSHLRRVENCKMLNFCKSSCGDDRSGEAWRLDNFWTGLDWGTAGIMFQREISEKTETVLSPSLQVILETQNSFNVCSWLLS